MVRQGMKAGLWVCLAACGLLHGCYGLEDDTIAKLGSFTVTPVTGLVTTEAGGSATFTVVLGRQPSSDVVIPLSSSNVQEATLSTPALTFTNANWNVPQTVTVTGADDFVDDGDIAYSILLSPAVSADYHFSGLDPADVAASNTDNDTAGVFVTPDSLSTNENGVLGGGVATFTVVLLSQPTADVSISINSSDITRGTVSTALLTFTSLNWNSAQPVTVTGVDDGSVANVPANTYSVLTGNTSSSDPNYSGLGVADVDLTNNDNDTAGVTVTPTTGLVTTEAGAGTDTFSVVLNTQPTLGNVVVLNVASSTTAEGTVSTATLTFGNGDWYIPQVVTVTGVNELFPVDDGDIAYTITVTIDAAATTETPYDTVLAPSVSALNLDDDSAGITVTPLVLTTVEGGTTVEFYVSLDTVPVGGTVVLNVASLNLLQGTVSPPTLTFDPNSTALAQQTVTVTPVDDNVTELTATYTIELTGDALAADPNYLNRNPADVVVTHNDNDTPGLTVTPTTLVTSESGTKASFTVVLNSIPASNVVITLGGLGFNASEGSLSATTLTFIGGIAGDWDDPQVVEVTGLEDILTDGPILYTLTGTATSSDSDYNTLPPFTVYVTNNDNDGQPPGSSPGLGTSALTPSTPSAFDDKRVMEPCVIQSAGPNFVLWYEGSNAAGQKHEQVGRATATLPTAWTRAPATPVLAHSGVNGTIDKNGVGDPCVLFIGAGDYRMWFGGRENASSKTKIGRATSTNGITWVKDTLSPGGPTTTILAGTPGAFDATGVASPHVILDGTYKMWYQGLDGAGVLRIGYATSTNGTTWTKNGPAVLDVGAAGAFDDGGVSTPCVIKDGLYYRMWYIGRDDPNPAGLQRMGYAQSTDGITWVKYASNPILGLGAPGAFDDTRLWSPWVVKDGALFRIWYAAENAAGDIRLAYTTSN